MANVQIPDELFFDLLEFFHDGSIIDRLAGSASFCEYQELQKGLDRKLDAMLARAYFSRYKSDPDPDQREEFRQRYLDQCGMSPSFRTSKEVRVDV